MSHVVPRSTKSKLLILGGLLGVAAIFISHLYGSLNIVAMRSSLGERLEVPRSAFVRSSNYLLYGIIVDSFRWSRKRKSDEFDSCRAALLVPNYSRICVESQAYYEHYRKKFTSSAWNPSSLMKLLGTEEMGLQKLFEDHPETGISVLSDSGDVLKSKIDKLTVKLIPRLTYRAVLTDLNGRKTVYRIIDRECYHPSMGSLMDEVTTTAGAVPALGPQIEFSNNKGLKEEVVEALHYEVCRSQGLKYLPQVDDIESEDVSQMQSVLDLGYLNAAKEIIKQESDRRKEENEARKKQADTQVDSMNRARLPSENEVLEAVRTGSIDPFVPRKSD